MMKFLLDCFETLKAWDKLSMNIQEPLTRPMIQESDLRKSFIARFLAVKDIDAQFGKDWTEVLSNLLLRGLLLEVANEDLHCGSFEHFQTPNGRSSRLGKMPLSLMKEYPNELKSG